MTREETKEKIFKSIAGLCHNDEATKEAVERVMEFMPSWVSVEDRLPEEDVMVLIETIHQPIVLYAVASWAEDQDCFLDYDENPLIASRWQPIPQNPTK